MTSNLKTSLILCIMHVRMRISVNSDWMVSKFQVPEQSKVQQNLEDEVK
jgi:hypothetical protein